MANLVEKIINVGELNQRIEFYELESYDAGKGVYKTRDVYVCDLWAKVSNLHGSEYYAAYAVKVQKEVSFTIRYRADVKETSIFKFRGNRYNVTYVDNVKYGNKYMECKAKLENR